MVKSQKPPIGALRPRFSNVEHLVGKLSMVTETTSYYRHTSFAYTSDSGFWYIPKAQNYRNPFMSSYLLYENSAIEVMCYLRAIEDALIGHYMVDVEE